MAQLMFVKHLSVFRYLTDDWELKQCIGWLKLLAKSMMGEEVAQQIIVVLSTELGIPPQSVVAAMRDRASVNDVAIYQSCVQPAA